MISTPHMGLELMTLPPSHILYWLSRPGTQRNFIFKVKKKTKQNKT